MESALKQLGRGRHSGFLLVGLLSPYGLMWNLAVVVFIGCSCFVWSLVQVGRGRHSDYEWGFKPLQAYVEPSRVSLMNCLF